MSDFVWPSTPAVGDTIEGPYGEVYTWDGLAWTITAGGAGGGTSVEVGDTPPASPGPGALWWDTVNVKLFMWDGGQWVVVSNVPEGGATGGGPPFMGVTDGSDAAPGEIGEFLIASASNVTVTSGNAAYPVILPLTPGDWDVTGHLLVTGGQNGVSVAITDLVWNVVPGGSSNGQQIGSISLTNITGLASITSTTMNLGLDAGPVRFSISAAMNAVLVVVIVFTGVASLTVSGQVSARRMR